MRSRAVRITVGAVAWIAVGLAALFLIRSEQEVTKLTASVRAFDLHAREVTDSLAELRVAQQAYVAAGQGVAFWMPKVTTMAGSARTAIVSLRQSAASGPARSSLMEAESTVAEFESVDARTRDYLKSGDHLMAADVIFTEGGETAATAGRQVEQARLAELQALDASEAAIRSRQAVALGVAAGFVLLIVVLLAFAPATPAKTDVAADTSTLGLSSPKDQRSGPPEPNRAAGSIGPMLRATADLCTDFGRVRDLADLRDLLARAASALDASGLVVWLGTTTGGDLQPIVSHGYSPQLVARMPSVPRSADNAAAAAYRTGVLQIVLSHPGGLSGALVAPMLAPDGCIGAFSAEIRNGGEGSETVQALAAIIAAHLAGVFAATATEPGETKTAAQG